MTETKTTEASEKVEKLDRDGLRARIFAAKNKRGDFEVIQFFGTEIELRQPSVGDMQKFSDDAEGGVTAQFTQILINYSYVPGTDEKVFEQGDLASLDQLPFNKDMQQIVGVIERFTSMSIQDAEKN